MASKPVVSKLDEKDEVKITNEKLTLKRTDGEEPSGTWNGTSVQNFANSALRYAAGALFRATSRMSREIEVKDLLESLEALENPKANVKDPAKPIAYTALHSNSASNYSGGSLDTIEGTPPEYEEDDFVDSELPEITLEKVSQHCTIHDAWMVIYDKVYDVTTFISQHPGGVEVMEEYMGYDATLAFRSVGHSPDAIKMLDDYLIGVLPEKEKMNLHEDHFSW